MFSTQKEPEAKTMRAVISLENLDEYNIWRVALNKPKLMGLIFNLYGSLKSQPADSTGVLPRLMICNEVRWYWSITAGYLVICQSIGKQVL